MLSMTDDTGTGGTADMNYELNCYAESYYEDCENERPEFDIVDYYGLKIKLGAFVMWCVACYCLLYWRPVLARKIEKRFILLRRMFYLSGFRHGWRGLHWKIKPKMELN